MSNEYNLLDFSVYNAWSQCCLLTSVLFFFVIFLETFALILNILFMIYDIEEQMLMHTTLLFVDIIEETFTLNNYD